MKITGCSLVWSKRMVGDHKSAGSNPVIPIMDRLRKKIEELKVHFNSSLDNMLEAVEEDKVYYLSLRINRLHAKLHELSGEVQRVVRESFK